MVAAHSVDAGAGRSGGRTEEQARVRRGVGVPAESRTGERLWEIHDAARDVSADVIWIVGFPVNGRGGAAGEDALAEAGGETFHLNLDAIGHRLGRAGGHVAIAPGGVLSRRCPRRVEKAGLRQQDEGVLDTGATPRRRLGCRDLLKGSANMDGRSLGAQRITPGNGAI